MAKFIEIEQHVRVLNLTQKETFKRLINIDEISSIYPNEDTIGAKEIGYKTTISFKKNEQIYVDLPYEEVKKMVIEAST